MARNVSDTLWATFRALGAECAFGLPGSQTIDAFQALKGSGLRTVVATHEMAAAFMAGGFARASGRPGILTTIPGPGFTYALTGLAEAWLDSVPIVHVVPAARELAGREYALQAIDQRAMAAPLVKRILQVTDARAVAPAAVEGYRLATAGEPGPVMVELPEELLAQEAGPPGEPWPAPPADEPAEAALDEIAEAIDKAPRLLMFLGAGALADPDAAARLAASTGAAIVTTTTARGVIPEDDARVVVRDPGMQDIAVLNALAGRADLILAIGCKFSHNGAAGFHLRLAREKLVAINAAGPSMNYPARIHATGDAGRALRGLAARIGARPPGQPGWDPAELAEWRATALKFESAIRFEPRVEASGQPVSALVDELRIALPDDAIVVTDSGLHQMSVRRYYTVRSPRGLIVPTNFQSMGYALPTAIGAAIAAPERRVVAIVGDGGMIMSGLELLTAVREGIRLTVVVFNDGAYSLIRNAQLAGHGASHGTELLDPDFEALACATGAEYRRVGTAGLAEALGGRERTQAGVGLIEVPLADSPGLRRIRARGKARAAARRLLPARARGFLARLLRR